MWKDDTLGLNISRSGSPVASDPTTLPETFHTSKKAVPSHVSSDVFKKVFSLAYGWCASGSVDRLKH